MRGFLEDLVRRRVPQITALYVGGGWALVSFLDWTVERYGLAPAWTEVAFLGLALLLPSVVLVAYFHGASGRQGWDTVERVGVFSNVVLTVVILALLVRSDLLTMSDPAAGRHVRRQVTFHGTVREVALAPDGAHLAYLVRLEGTTRSMLLSLDGGETIELAAAEDLRSLDWYPDGEALQVRGIPGRVRFGLYRIPVDGGEHESAGRGYYRSWSADGTAHVNAYQNSPELIVTRTVGTRQELIRVPLQDDYRWIQEVAWSPAADLVAVTRTAERGSAVVAVAVTGPDQYVIVEDSLDISSVNWGNDGGFLYYAIEDRGFFRVSVIPETGAPLGDPEALPITTIGRAGDLSVSRDGLRIAYVDGTRGSNLWAVSLDSDGPPPRRLTSGTSSKGSLFGPGHGFSFGYLDSLTGESVSVIDLSKNTPTVGQVAHLPHEVYSAAWSPDGGTLAVVTSVSEGFGIWTGALGADLKPLVRDDLNRDARMTWCGPDEVVYQTPDVENLRFVNPESGEERVLLDARDGWLLQAACTVDGTLVAVFWNRQGHGLWTISPDGENERLMAGGDVYPRVWSSDGRWLYAWDHDENTVIRFPREGGDPEVVVRLPYDPADVVDVWPMPEKAVVVVSVREDALDVWLEENFLPAVR